MDYLFSPWRYRYVSQVPAEGECVLCRNLAGCDDRANGVVYRGAACAVLLNAFPYTTGHVMVLPLAHVADLGAAGAAARAEMMELAAASERILGEEYRPDGLNVGLNLGAAAGAGIAAHLHLHVVPRWRADANFMTVIGETRVLPEALDRTWERLQPRFAALRAGK